MDSRSHGIRDLLRTLKGYVARQADGKIGEVAVARPADTYAIHFEQSIHLVDCGHDVGTHTRRGGVEQRVDGSARQPRTHVHDDSSDEEGGHGIGNMVWGTKELLDWLLVQKRPVSPPPDDEKTQRNRALNLAASLGQLDLNR